MGEPVSSMGTAGERGQAPVLSAFPSDDLLRFMEETIQVFSMLHRVLLQEKSGILRADVSQVEQQNQAKEDLISRIRDLDETRATLWQEIGARIQRDPSSLTLSDLLNVGPMTHSGEFSKSLSTLSDILQTVRQANSDNRDLVLGALNLLKGSISLLTTLLHGQGVYQKTGAIGVGSGGGRLLSGAA